MGGLPRHDLCCANNVAPWAPDRQTSFVRASQLPELRRQPLPRMTISTFSYICGACECELDHTSDVASLENLRTRRIIYLRGVQTLMPDPKGDQRPIDSSLQRLCAE